MTWLSSIDQMGLPVSLSRPPERIVSLVPSQTELLFDLGLEEKIVGVTKFCIHPENARKAKAIIGGTKTFDFERINRLNPDLIIGNKEENYEEGIMSLRGHCPVWMSNVEMLDDALSMIASVAQITDREVEGAEILRDINSAFGVIKAFPPLRTLYLMWRDPWMGAAGNTFIHAMMARSGLANVLAKASRYPELTAEQIQRLYPEVVLLSSEPFPFSQRHIFELRELLPEARILLVDGEYFSWYGSRLRLAPPYIMSLNLHE